MATRLKMTLAKTNSCQGHIFVVKLDSILEKEEAVMEKKVQGFPVVIMKDLVIIEKVRVIDLANFAQEMIVRRKADPSLSFKVLP